jgi:hypothetical protein
VSVRSPGHSGPSAFLDRISPLFPPSGPLLWIGDESSVDEWEQSGYVVCSRQAAGDPSAMDGVGFAGILWKMSSSGGSILGVMAGLNDVAVMGALFMIEISGSGLSDASDRRLFRSSVTAMLAYLGWNPLTTGPLEDDSRWLAFQRQKTGPRYRLSNPSSVDHNDCLALFEKAFGEPPHSGLWNWKYGGGRGVSVIARREGRLVAHYGCVTRAILWQGRPARAVQICDVMVDPAERGVMTRHGAFCMAARASQESIIGADDRYLCGFGFPNHRHMVLGDRAGLYVEVESMVELGWACRTRKPSLATTARRVRVTDHVPVIDVLWAQMTRDLTEAMVGVRDANYLQYRYEEHPRFHYEIHLISRRWGTPLGLLVLRREGDLCRLIDAVGPLRYGPLWVEYARRIAAAGGAVRLLAWISSAQASRLETADSSRQPLDIKIPANRYIERVPVMELKNRWWLMMGDTDFM